MSEDPNLSRSSSFGSVISILFSYLIRKTRYNLEYAKVCNSHLIRSIGSGVCN